MGEYSLRVSEMNDSNIIRDGKEELRILCYKEPTLHVKWYGVIYLHLD